MQRDAFLNKHTPLLYFIAAWQFGFGDFDAGHHSKVSHQEPGSCVQQDFLRSREASRLGLRGTMKPLGNIVDWKDICRLLFLSQSPSCELCVFVPGFDLEVVYWNYTTFLTISPYTPPSPSFLALAALGKLFCRGIKRSHKRAKFGVGGWGLVSSLNGFNFFCYVLFKEMHLPMIPVSPVKWINCSITLLIQYCACWCCISIR